MAEYGLNKNAEGYHDPTPYQAIKNMVKPGEIWTFQKKDNTEAEVLVVAFGDNIATILYLIDEYKDGCVECALKWVNPRMLNWSWGGFLSKRVKKLSDHEFDQILDAVEDALEIQIPTKEVAPIPVDLAKEDELKALHYLLEEAEKRAVALSDELSMARIEASKGKIQLATMKEMYSDLMEKFLQRA